MDNSAQEVKLTHSNGSVITFTAGGQIQLQANATVEITARLAQQIPVVAITDSPFSPLTQSAKIWFEVAEADFGAFRAMSGTFSLAMTLAVAVGRRRSSGG